MNTYNFIRKPLFGPFILTALLISSCSALLATEEPGPDPHASTTAAAQTGTAELTRIAEEQPPTAAPTEIPPTATATLLPPSPTATATSLPPSPTATVTSPPLSPTATDEQTYIAALMAATAPESLQVFTSPDQSWQAEIVRYDCTLLDEVGGELEGVPIAYEQLILTGPDGEETPVADQRQYCGGLGAAGINGLFWSPDEKYFYFDNAREGVPDGMACGYWEPRKSRVNMETLEVEVLPGKGPFSPDGSSLLLAAGPDFILWDLDQGEVGRSAHLYTGLSVNSIAFSPDGGQAVYVLREDCFRPGIDSYVVVLNLADLTHTIVLESSAPSILLATWGSEDRISLVDFDGETYELSLSTGEITPR